MKRPCRICLIAAALLAVSVLASGCSLKELVQQLVATPVPAVTPTPGPAGPSAEEIAILQAEIALTREETGKARAAAQADADRTAPVVVACAGCSINGSASFRLKEAGESVTVRAEVPNDLIFDHWEINGERLDEEGPVLTIAPESSCFIEAFTCRRRILTAVHATFRLLDGNGKAGGKNFAEFDFEEDYFNPASETYHTGGTISAVITASVPVNHEIAYWLIDGIVYRFNRTVTSITVTDLDRAAVYEPVFKSKGAADPDPAPRPDPRNPYDPPNLIPNDPGTYRP